MTNIVAGDVTYTMKTQRTMHDSRKINRVQLVFGDSALTYPAGGIPITIGKLGCPTVVESLIVVDQGTSGYKFQYDSTNAKLVVMQAPVQTHTHNLKVIGGGTVVTNGNAGLDSSTGLVKIAPNDATILGANSATLGGVASTTLAAAALSEASTVAIAAQTIIVEVIGW